VFTGCCHQTVTTLADYALTHVATGPTLYGLYGGPHMPPFDPSLSPKQERMIADLGAIRSAWFRPVRLHKLADAR